MIDAKSMRIVAACGVALSIQLLGCEDGTIGERANEPFEEPPIAHGPTNGAGVGTYDQPLVVATDPPPPLSGGTLLVFDKGHKAAVADPDRDQVVIADLDQATVISTIALQKGDEPGRSVVDASGVLHVVLRRGGAIAVIDPAGGKLVRRDAACGYPRGIAYDPVSDAVHVACAGGELVTLSANGGQPTRTVMLPRDLRDVVVDGDHLLVSRFRAAELLVLDAQGSVLSTIRPPGLLNDPSRQFAPAVAWRTMAAPGGGVLMVHQQELVGEVLVQPGGYGGGGFGCGSIVQSAISLLRQDGTGWTAPLSQALAIDMAVAVGDSPTIYLPAAGLPNSTSMSPLMALSLPVVPANQPNVFDAGADPSGAPFGTPCSPLGTPIAVQAGPVVAVGVDSLGVPILQTRDPFGLVWGDKTLSLPGDSRRDTGRDIFHLATSAGLACASCHPEGRDDGHVWKFSGQGARRTQSVGGGILGTEPFHWSGDMNDFLTLAHEVFNTRMLGPTLGDDYVTALSKWIDTIPAWKPGPSADVAAIERGRTVFTSAEAACSTCHVGAKMTNNTSVDVGTGGQFQVPSLRGVAWRAPLMHDGCATSLSDRFGTCGGTKHGKIPTAGTAQADLVAYLESL